MGGTPLSHSVNESVGRAGDDRARFELSGSLVS